MKIAVLGVGYVGLVTSTCFSELGNDVIGVDIDPKKIANLKKGIIPIYEPGLDELVKKNIAAGRINFTTDITDAVRKSEIIFIAVGTPPQEDGSADLQYVLAAAESIAKAANSYKIIVNKSTVPIGTGKMVTNAVKKYFKGNFDVVSNPEFLREGSAVDDFLHPDRVVIGHASSRARKLMHELYEPLNAPVLFTNIETAEMIKYASNSLLATEISFINSVANICEKVGADVNMVSEGMKLDKRIGRHAFLSAGAGYGGSCFPKDVKALIQIARRHDYHFKILEEVENVNHAQRDYIVDNVLKMLKTTKNKTVAVWGIAFKPETDDIREAPAIDIIKSLQENGIKIHAYDPIAENNAKTIFKKVTYFSKPLDATKNADMLLIATEWKEFSQLDLKNLKKNLKKPMVFDTRNIYNPDLMKKNGFVYKSIGR